MPRGPVLLFASMICLAAAGGARAEETRLTLLHTTDLHGSLAAYDDVADRPARRGLVKIATLVAAARRDSAPVLLLDAGDALQGSPLVRTWRRGERRLPEPVIEAMNRIGYDAMAVGNHEFDFGRAELEKARAAAKFPFLAANIVRADGTPAFDRSIVRTIGGVRVGIVGVCTGAVPFLADSALWAGLRFQPPNLVAKEEVARLRKVERCGVVILVAHTGLETNPQTGTPRKDDTDYENAGDLLAWTVPGVDVLILGHTHTVIPSAEMGGVLVAQAGSNGEGLGRIDLTLRRESPSRPWSVASKRGRWIAVTDSTESDAALAAFVAPYAAASKAAMDEVVGEAKEDLSSPAGRFADGPLWQLFHRAQLETSGADVSLAPLFDPNARIARGPVRMRDVLRLAPYENTVVVVELRGSVLRDVLERSAGTFAPYNFADGRALMEPGVPGHQFEMASGVTYAIDLTAERGRRVVDLRFRGEPVRREQTFRVAVSNYRANGGGGTRSFTREPKLSRSDRPITDLLAETIRRSGPLDARVSPSWRLLPDYVASPERPLIDRLVRLGVIAKDDPRLLNPGAPARRVDLASDLGRAFGWREARRSGAYRDVPDSLEPWVDGVLKRRVLGQIAMGERFEPARVVSLSAALDWSERAARAAGYALATPMGDPAFRRGLLTGLGLPRDARGVVAFPDTLTRLHWLALLSNLRYPVVRVLETTDFHGNILPGPRDRRTGRSSGGTVALAGWIERLRAENPEGTVLLDGGDIFQGTMISNLQFGRPVVEQMNALGYTAAAVGNHEFDWGVDTLVRRVDEMRFSALGANMVERASGRRPRWVRADTSFLRRGARVSVLGLCYPGTPRVTMPANVAHLRFEDDSATAAALVPKLRASSSVVVAVGHIPAETDSTRRASGDLARLARGVKGVDAWFGGHSHNVVSDQFEGIPAQIPGAHANWIAISDLAVDPVARRVVERRSRLQQTFADEVSPDSAWIARVERWNADVAPVAAERLGRATVALHRERPEATIGDFITDAMRAQVGVDVAMQNPGGMRANLDAGEITRGEIYEIMPFDNTIVTIELTGAEVRRALEQALRFDRVTQVSGIRYAYDASKPAMSRVVRVSLPDGAPLDESKTYRVAVNNFMASGGDNYDALGQGRNRNDTGLIIRGAMEAYVRKVCVGGGELNQRSDGRIERIRGE